MQLQSGGFGAGTGWTVGTGVLGTQVLKVMLSCLMPCCDETSMWFMNFMFQPKKIHQGGMMRYVIDLKHFKHMVEFKGVVWMV